MICIINAITRYKGALVLVSLLAIILFGSCKVHREAQRSPGDAIGNTSYQPHDTTNTTDTSKNATFRKGIQSSLREKLLPSMKKKMGDADDDDK